VLKPGAVPAELILERLAKKISSSFSIASSLKKFFVGFLRSPFVADAGIQVSLVPVWP
jgi:hypothetical protein